MGKYLRFIFIKFLEIIHLFIKLVKCLFSSLTGPKFQCEFALKLPPMISL